MLRFHKTDGILAFHGISVLPGETTPETAHEIGVRLARKLWANLLKWWFQPIWTSTTCIITLS
jgi:hypothetical protein